MICHASLHPPGRISGLDWAFLAHRAALDTARQAAIEALKPLRQQAWDAAAGGEDYWAVALRYQQGEAPVADAFHQAQAATSREWEAAWAGESAS